MKIENIKEICSSLDIKTVQPPQHIRVLITADHNDADYVREETILIFEDSELPIILAGLKALSTITDFEELYEMPEDTKKALCDWSNLVLDEEDKITFDNYSFEDDENLTGMIPYSDEGCCCGDNRIKGCHSLESVQVSIVDEDGKILIVDLGAIDEYFDQIEEDDEINF